ncbi:MAG: NrtA/SsuA/CpmA family ABC transporter substrate-binding protein [Proteobacteria bacterium]|nr:NrtA/SsuA/CpmA family ABC transporter substrate-binding protein [Pseudomonadota bacterium]
MWSFALLAASGIIIAVWLTKQNSVSPSGPPEKVVIAGLSLPGAGLFFVAKEKGYFGDEKLDVDLRLYTTGKLAIDSLFSGNADFAIAGDTPIVFSILGDRKLDILSTVYRPNGGIAIIARKDRAAAPGDMKGKRLGVTFVSSGQFVADTFLLVHGIPQSDLTLLNMPQEEMVAALLAGNIDAACMWQPHLADTQAKLGDKGITFPNAALYTFRLSLVAKRGYASEYPNRVRKVLAALKQAQRYTVANPASALDIMSRFTGIDKTTFKRFYDPAEYDLGLEQGLLLALDDQTRWAIQRGFVNADKMPNYLDFIYADGLGAVSPESVKFIR